MIVHRRRGPNLLSARAELNDLLSTLDSVEPRSSPYEVASRLIGDELLWWRCCKEAIREDPDWLVRGEAERLLEFIALNAVGSLDERRAAVAAATATFHIARALCAPPETFRPASLKSAVDHWSAAYTLPQRPSGAGLLGAAGLAVADDPVRHRLDAVIRSLTDLGDDPSRAMAALTALLLAGANLKERPVERISTVFGRPGQDQSEEGAAGALELRELEGGPAGLFPDPRTMGGIRADPSFLSALSLAWNTSPGPRGGRCVVWQLVLDGSPTSSVEGPSLGAAGALALRELLRRPISRRPSVAWVRLFFHRAFNGPRPRTAITGAIDRNDRLVEIKDMAPKLLAAHLKGWRLVAPKDNDHDIGSAPDPGAVDFAADLKEAARYARRLRPGRAVAAVAAVAALSLVGYIASSVSSAAADKQRTADRLASLSKSLLGSDLDLAQLFAVQAFRTAPNSQTRSALFNAVTTSPHLVRYFQADDQISVIASSADGKTALAGTKNGTLYRWTLSSGKRTTMLRVRSGISSISTDAKATTAAVIAGATARLWALGEGARDLRIPADQEPTAAGVSPSGRFVVVATQAVEFGAPSGLVLFDRTTGRSKSVALRETESGFSSVAIPNDSEVVGLDGAYGIWQRRSLPGLKLVAGGGVGFGTHNYGTALAPSGRFFSYSNNGDSLPIWTTDKPSAQPAKPRRTVPTRGSQPTALAISGDGTRIAQGAEDGIFVSDTKPTGTTPPGPIALTGNPKINNGALAFTGDQDRLLSASGNQLTLWNLRQSSRMAITTRIQVPFGCNACSSPLLAVQPGGGKSAAVIDGNGTLLTVNDPMSASTADMSLPADLTSDPTYGPPVWSRDGRQIILIHPRDGSAEIHSPTLGLPITGQWPASPNSATAPPDPPAYVRMSPDGSRLIEIDSSGTTKIRDPANGNITRRVDGPRDMTPTGDGFSLSDPATAAADANGEHTAIINDDPADDDTAPTVFVSDISSGKSRTITGETPSGVAFIGDQLLIQRSNGTLEVRNSTGTDLQRTIDGDAANVVGPVTNGTDTIVEERSDGTVTVIDFGSGETIGKLTLPTPYKYAKTGMAFSPDGRTLVTVTEGQGNDSPAQLIRWNFSPQDWAKAACASSARQLSPAEWRQYVGTSPPSDLTCK